MYGLIGKFTASSGRREALMELLLEASRDMPGCLSYVVAADLHDADVIWVTEVWESEQAHERSLALPAVRQAVERGRSWIADMEQPQLTRPVGGVGLPPQPGSAP